MVRLNLAVAALAASAVSASASSSNSIPDVNVRGINPADTPKYQPHKDAAGHWRWKCLDGSKEVSWKAVNDDYCDCADGSDEPGTSACPNSTFYCANHGHIPSTIPSNRVNDGICDPECCDGTDETDGKAVCPDRCEKVGKEWRKKQAELANVRRAGLKIRDRYISDGRKQKEALQAEIAKLQVELQVAQENENRLKEELRRAETIDKAVIDAKTKTPLYSKLTAHQSALKSLTAKNAALKEELKTLTLLLDDLAKSYNPNYQDMAVKGAVVAYKQWRAGSDAIKDDAASEEKQEADRSSNDLSTENKKLAALFEEGEWDASTLMELVREDPLDIMDGGLNGAADKSAAVESDGGLLFRVHEYLPDALVPYFEAMVDTLLDVLIKANIITDVKRMRPKIGDNASEPENVAVARKAHTDAANHLSKIRNDLDDRNRRVEDFGTKYGRQGEFKALENQCISKDMGEYTYEYCFFGRAKQIPNNGGAQISLGGFTNWNPKEDRSPADDEYWMQQIYARGQKCWNGPERSAIVDLVCDATNAVLDVFEAEKCIYSIKISTPAVCFPAQDSAADSSSSSSTTSASNAEHVHVKEEL